MGGFSDLADSINSACLDAFGEPGFTLRRVQSGNGMIPLEGILDAGVQLEVEKPGEGVLARLFIKDSAVPDPPADKGDEIETATMVYTIVDIDRDAGRGVSLYLRQARSLN